MPDRVISLAPAKCGRCGQLAVVELPPTFLDDHQGVSAYRIVKCQACKFTKEIHHESWLGLQQEAALLKRDGQA